MYKNKQRKPASLDKRRSSYYLLVFVIVLTFVFFSKGAIRQDVENAKKANLDKDFSTVSNDVICETSKGKFRIILNPKESPIGVNVFKELLRQKFFNAGEGIGNDDGVAFFRVNKVATQFGIKERRYQKQFNWKALNLTSENWTRDPNPLPKSKRHSWPRG